MKTKEPQNAQVIFADALRRNADETNAPGFEITEGAGVIKHLAVLGRVECVDGEVAARRVFGPIVGECHGRAPAIRGHVASQRRDLEWLAVDDCGDGAMLDSGRQRGDVRRGKPPHDLVGHERRSDIDVIDLAVQKRIAYRAAHKSCFGALCRQRLHHCAGFV